MSLTPFDDDASQTLLRLEQAEQLKIAGEYQEALVMLEELLLEDPKNVSALEEIADNELSLGAYDRAEAAAQEAIALDAESYTAYYILGFLRSRTEDWQESISFLKVSNHLKPNNAEILRCLGWALFNMGHKTQGIVTLERALNLDAESALTLCDLGVAYLQVQNFPKAQVLFQRALDLEPANERAKECLQATVKLITLLPSHEQQQTKQVKK